MKAKKYFYMLVMPFMKLYWRIVQPQTFGVKVLIVHPSDKDKVLLVRHTYGNMQLWNIPGGGFRPSKETALEAAMREVHEELGVALLDPKEIGEYKTRGEGKRDTVSMFSGTIAEPQIGRTSDEIAEAAWVASTEAHQMSSLARVARQAIQLHFFS